MRGLLFESAQSRYAHEPMLDPENCKEKQMSLGTLLVIVLILMLVGVIPTWPHSRNWGYLPSSALGLIVLILIVLILMGRI